MCVREDKREEEQEVKKRTAELVGCAPTELYCAVWLCQFSLGINGTGRINTKEEKKKAVADGMEAEEEWKRGGKKKKKCLCGPWDEQPGQNGAGKEVQEGNEGEEEEEADTLYVPPPPQPLL